MSFFYRFPAVRPDLTASSSYQASKISEEVEEAIEAIEDYRSRPSRENRIAYGMELMDVIHAAETALRIEFTGEEVDDLTDAVILKNLDRKYYEDMPGVRIYLERRCRENRYKGYLIPL